MKLAAEGDERRDCLTFCADSLDSCNPLLIPRLLFSRSAPFVQSCDYYRSRNVSDLEANSIEIEKIFIKNAILRNCAFY